MGGLNLDLVSAVKLSLVASMYQVALCLLNKMHIISKNMEVK